MRNFVIQQWSFNIGNAMESVKKQIWGQSLVYQIFSFGRY